MEFFKNVKWFFEELHEANKEFVSGVRQDVKEFRTDMKDIVKEHNPTVNYHFISEQKRHFFAHSFRKPSPLF
ncbi:hypothetical protein [Geobacillus sp. FSL W8-1251]|uniref:hypothetical protein n=1 Tax=Geobacillus sp. FSL W8-1251 TaxID=2954650 RepID=UPI0030FBB10F